MLDCPVCKSKLPWRKAIYSNSHFVCGGCGNRLRQRRGRGTLLMFVTIPMNIAVLNLVEYVAGIFVGLIVFVIFGLISFTIAAYLFGQWEVIES